MNCTRISQRKILSKMMITIVVYSKKIFLLSPKQASKAYEKLETMQKSRTTMFHISILIELSLSTMQLEIVNSSSESSSSSSIFSYSSIVPKLLSTFSLSISLGAMPSFFQISSSSSLILYETALVILYKDLE
jgi:hypothetical protein